MNKKIIKVKHINSKFHNEDLFFLTKELDKIQEVHIVGIVPWQEYPYKPKVHFKIAYSDNEILLKVSVKENFIRAKYDKINDPVYRDSCFEFFISPDNNDQFYNYEFNCIGTPYLAYGKPKINRQEASTQVVQSIRRLSSLGSQTFEEKQGNFEWEMTIAIPLATLFKHNLKDMKGKTCHVNFYKCGDELTKPHYLAWNNIETGKPDFHRPEFFGKIIFE